MRVIPSIFSFRRRPGVLSNGLFRSHYFAVFLDEQKDRLCGTHLDGSFDVLLKAKYASIEWEFELKTTFIDFDIDAY